MKNNEKYAYAYKHNIYVLVCFLVFCFVNLAYTWLQLLLCASLYTDSARARVRTMRALARLTSSLLHASFLGG